jgi:superfamily I DNA and/or RNA helicase
MFDISNAISYDGNMVQSTDVPGKAYWYDVSGSASDKYVKEQGEFLRDKILELFNQNPDINDKSKKDIIYVISPFKNVAYQLSQELKQIGFTRYGENGKPTNIGTVHTFQGKEAPIVFLVLGCDERSRGAANWAMGSANPNIMNVAATRAKEEFYIIGDKQLFLGMKSDVINETYRILERFNNGNK